MSALAIRVADRRVDLSANDVQIRVPSSILYAYDPGTNRTSIMWTEPTAQIPTIRTTTLALGAASGLSGFWSTISGWLSKAGSTIWGGVTSVGNWVQQ